MKTTLVGDYADFAAASRVAAELMIAGIPQAQISVVGRDKLADGARFAFAGALAAALSGAREHDFEARLVQGLAGLCVPPRAAVRHAAALADGGGLVVLHVDADRARKAEGVMLQHGPAERYAAGVAPLGRRDRRLPCAA